MPDRWIEITWPVWGDRLPADHNYRLYSALVTLLPQLKEQDWQLKTINGIPDRKGWIKLGRESRLGIRCDLSLLGQFDALQGHTLRVGQCLLQLGELTGRSLSVAKPLESRLVTIKQGAGDDFSFFCLSLGKQLGNLGIHHLPTIGQRCTLRVKDCTIVGYQVRFSDLSDAESLTLQRHGLGGKHRMGCGTFWGIS
jgi:CRISPR-associated protein Cas6